MEVVKSKRRVSRRWEGRSSSLQEHSSPEFDIVNNSRKESGNRYKESEQSRRQSVKSEQVSTV